jgi:hypothetical protein
MLRDKSSCFYKKNEKELKGNEEKRYDYLFSCCITQDTSF